MSSCGSCSAANGCGVQLLPTAQSAITIECSSQAHPDLTIGDRVAVRVPEPDAGWLRVVGFAYGMPSLGMVLGALAGHWGARLLQMPDSSELFTLLGFFLGLAGGLIAWSRAEKTVRKHYNSASSPQLATVVERIQSTADTRLNS